MAKSPEQVRGTAKHAANAVPGELRAESVFHKATSPTAVSANVNQPRPPLGSDAVSKKMPSSSSDLVAGSNFGAGALPRNHSLMSAGKDSSGGGGSGDSSGYGSSLSQVGSTSSLNLQERKQQQLKLINEKLAKRHSRLPWKDTPTQPDDLSNKVSSSGEREVKKMLNQPSKGPKSTNFVQKGRLLGERKETEIAKSAAVESPGIPTASAAPMKPTLSRELPGKSVAWPLLDPSSTDEKLRAQTGALFTRDPLPNSVDGKALDSETSFLPVYPTSFAEQALNGSSETTHEPESQDTDFYVSSLLSSLNSAYGYSSMAEKSRLLSTLVGGEKVGSIGSASAPEEKDCNGAAIKIQSAYRGYLARRECKRHSKNIRAATLIQAAW